MFGYRTPGVYFRPLDTRQLEKGLKQGRTDIAGFVGLAERGPLHCPVKIESWNQFTSTFGGPIPQAYLAYSVKGFFDNGGQTCWIVRVANPDAANPARLTLLDTQDPPRPALLLEASSPGSWGNRLIVSVTRTTANRYLLGLQLPTGEQELWPNLSMQPSDPRYLVTVLEAGSGLLRAYDLSKAAPVPAELSNSLAQLSGGLDGLAALGIEHFSGIGGSTEQPWGLALLEQVDEISIVAMPDALNKPQISPTATNKEWPKPCDQPEAPPGPVLSPERPLEFPPVFSGPDFYRLQVALIAHCELLKDRMAILDVRPEDTTPEQLIAWRNRFNTSYAALYAPWLQMPDPLALQGLVRAVPPSGHVAGVYARGDRQRGVYKPPANVRLEQVAAVAIEFDDVRHGVLNEVGINLIRAYPGRGLRVAGARTLTDASSREWLFVNVRRLLIMIEEALQENLQWTIFEPNNPDLWRDIDRVVRSFLHQLWQHGFLDGATAEQAYFVRCDETTNPPEEIEAGRAICLIGVQPPWPAEFVIIRIGKTQDGTEIFEAGGVS